MKKVYEHKGHDVMPLQSRAGFRAVITKPDGERVELRKKYATPHLAYQAAFTMIDSMIKKELKQQ